MEEIYLTLAQTADELKLEYNTIRKYVQEGKFKKTIKRGKNRMIAKSEVMEWKAAATTKVVYQMAGQ